MRLTSIALLCVIDALSSAQAADQYDTEAIREAVQITATREPEPVDKVPASISIVTGEELRSRGAN